MLGEADIDDFRIAEFEPALFQRLVERGGAPGSRSPDSNLHAFEVAERLVAAAVDVVLAHHQRGKAVAWLDGGLVGHDFHENAAPDGADKHRTGAVYNVPTGPGGLQSFTAPSVLSSGSWNDVEITVRNHRYTVSINNKQTTDFTNPRNNLVTDTPGLPLRLRGLVLSEDPLSGYIGIQAHTGNVAFKNIRLKRL